MISKTETASWDQQQQQWHQIKLNTCSILLSSKIMPGYTRANSINVVLSWKQCTGDHWILFLILQYLCRTLSPQYSRASCIKCGILINKLQSSQVHYFCFQNFIHYYANDLLTLDMNKTKLCQCFCCHCNQILSHYFKLQWLYK